MQKAAFAAVAVAHHEMRSVKDGGTQIRQGHFSVKRNAFKQIKHIAEIRLMVAQHGHAAALHHQRIAFVSHGGQR